jgi:hypothetical protein
VHTNVWDAWDPNPDIREWVRGLETGDVLEVFAMAIFRGWENHVFAVEIDLYCA